MGSLEKRLAELMWKDNERNFENFRLKRLKNDDIFVIVTQIESGMWIGKSSVNLGQHRSTVPLM